MSRDDRHPTEAKSSSILQKAMIVEAFSWSFFRSHNEALPSQVLLAMPSMSLHDDEAVRVRFRFAKTQTSERYPISEVWMLITVLRGDCNQILNPPRMSTYNKLQQHSRTCSCQSAHRLLKRMALQALAHMP